MQTQTFDLAAMAVEELDHDALHGVAGGCGFLCAVVAGVVSGVVVTVANDAEEFVAGVRAGFRAVT